MANATIPTLWRGQVRIAILAFLCALSVGSAQGGEAKGIFLNENQFLEQCRTEDTPYWGRCMGYVAGVWDWYVSYFKPEEIPFCAPDFSDAQLVRIVVKFIQQNPEKAHIQGAALVVQALVNAYPC